MLVKHSQSFGDGNLWTAVALMAPLIAAQTTSRDSGGLG